MENEKVSKEEKGNGVLADVIGSSSEWNRLAEAIKDEFGESIIDAGDEDNAYDWWLTDITVNDIIDFLKNYR